jgi:hypothetical protein
MSSHTAFRVITPQRHTPGWFRRWLLAPPPGPTIGRKRRARRARGRAIASRPPYSAAALACGNWRTVDIARAGGFQAYQRKWAFLFAADKSDCFDCGLSQEDARDELQRIERSL